MLTIERAPKGSRFSVIQYLCGNTIMRLLPIGHTLHLHRESNIKLSAFPRTFNHLHGDTITLRLLFRRIHRRESTNSTRSSPCYRVAIILLPDNTTPKVTSFTTEIHEFTRGLGRNFLNGFSHILVTFLGYSVFWLLHFPIHLSAFPSFCPVCCGYHTNPSSSPS